MDTNGKLAMVGRYAFAAIMVLILFLPLTYYFGRSENVAGTLTSFYNVQIESQPVHIIVELDDGRTIQASAPDKFDFRKGHKVLLNERTTVWGGKNYQFLAYIDQQQVK